MSPLLICHTMDAAEAFFADVIRQSLQTPLLDEDSSACVQERCAPERFFSLEELPERYFSIDELESDAMAFKKLSKDHRRVPDLAEISAIVADAAKELLTWRC